MIASDTPRFVFRSLIYSGVDYPEDGIGNHLALLDQLVFNSDEIESKSFSEVLVHAGHYRSYGAVPPFAHIQKPESFESCMYIDVSRDMFDPDRIEQQRRRALDFKAVYNAVTAIYLFSESDKIWDGLAGLLKAYDFCIVTSDFLVSELEYYGLDFVVLPHPYRFAAVDPETIDLEHVPSPLRFGISAGLWKRKNVALLVKAFADVFGNSDRHSLCIHTRFDPEGATDQKREFDLIKGYLEGHANIEFVNRTLPREDYLLWLASVDVYCLPSSGEGFSVTPREALHLGKPVVLSDAHVHRQLRGLPGVVPVTASTLKPATPNTDVDMDIGFDWAIDETSLRDCLRMADSNYLELKRAIAARYGEILRLHDIDRIKKEWTEKLNDRYTAYVTSSRGALFTSDVLREEWAEHFTPQSFPVTDNGFGHNTGEIVGQRLYCFVARHEPGHCLYGPDYRVRIARPYVAEFYMTFIHIAQFDTPLVTLDIYDTASKEIIAMRDVVLPGQPEYMQKIELGFQGRRDQVLEFRIYWHKTCDIEVCKVMLRPLGGQDLGGT